MDAGANARDPDRDRATSVKLGRPGRASERIPRFSSTHWDAPNPGPVPAARPSIGTMGWVRIQSATRTRLGQISTGVDNDASAAATAGSDWTSPGADRGAPQASQRHTNRPI
jgi:hypothetical protein